MTTRSRQRWHLLWLLSALTAGGGLLSCQSSCQPSQALKLPLPLHVENKPLVPKGTPPPPTHWETSSAVLPPGNALCPDGCVFIGYGNLGVSLMQGKLSCLGQPDCLENVTLPVPADLVSGVNGSVGDGGVCVGGDPPTQARYTPAWTDGAITRAFDDSIVFVAGGLEYFADPKDGCKLHSHVVDLITRTEDAGAHWSHAAVLDGTDPGDPFYFGGMDRPTIYADPFDQKLYLTGGGAVAEGGGINTVALWSSSDNGKAWTRLGNPVSPYGYAPDLALVGTPGRLFIGFCPYDEQVSALPDGLPNPDKKGSPVLGWSDDGGHTFQYANVFYDSAPESRCGMGVLKYKDGVIQNNFPAFTLSRARQEKSTVESIRVAYSTLTSTGRQTFRVVTARISKAKAGKLLSLTPSLAPELSGDVAAIHPDFVPTDRFELQDSEPLNDAALLSWLELDDVASSPPQMTVRYRLVVDEAGWSLPHDLSILKAGDTVQRVAWKLNLVQTGPKVYFASDIDEGSFYFDKTKSPPTLNFLTTWTQSHDADATPNGYIHFNIVSVNNAFVFIENN